MMSGRTMSCYTLLGFGDVFMGERIDRSTAGLFFFLIFFTFSYSHYVEILNERNVIQQP